MTFFQLIKIFHLPSLKKEAINYIERCFTALVEEKSFLEISFNCLKEILLSSELYVTSELEIYKFAEKWLNHSIEEREQHAKHVLRAVRLNLLSKDTLRCLLNDPSCFSKIKECVAVIDEFLREKGVCNEHRSKINRTSRYCSQKHFNMLVCGGINTNSNAAVGNVQRVSEGSLNEAQTLPSMINARRHSQAVYVKGEVFVFDDITWKSIEKYSPITNTWTEVAEMPDTRQEFCVCAFMDQIFMFGGNYDGPITNTCLKFDTKAYQWTKIAAMDVERSNAASVAYGEMVVVSGGHCVENDYEDTFLIVESYDVLPKKWSKMPSMISSKLNHSLVAVKSKLFAIDLLIGSCEVYDSVCKKFALLKPKIYLELEYTDAMPIGKYIYIFENHSTVVHRYDVDENLWQREPCEATISIEDFFCVKVPMF